MNISAVIVLYGKSVSDSLTYNTIFKYREKFNKIVIYNNGPGSVELPSIDNTSQFELINDLSNSPLSKIYNDFINNNLCDRYVFFDDDSTITDEYINNLLSDPQYYDVGIPLIHSSHDMNIYYPVISRIKNIFNEKYILPKKSYSIGSGLILSSSVVLLIKNKFGNVFDERFVLYGVDLSVFFRLDTIIDSRDILCSSQGVIVHDLSKFHQRKSKFRIEELLIDQVLQYKIYHKNIKRFAYYLFRNFKEILTLSPIQHYRVIKSFIKKRHPKSR